MSYALIELEATARKAARGAGYGWGMAEEAGKAARWLCSAGLDGCAALVEALSATDEAGPGALAPVVLQGDWHSASGTLCPLMAGAALSDAAELWQGDRVKMLKVTAPMLLLPFAAYAARALGTPVSVAWDGVEAVTDGLNLSLKSAASAALTTPAAHVLVRSGARLGTSRPHTGRARPQDADWDALNAFAARTYAPSTPESRLKGAGAGLSDND